MGRSGRQEPTPEVGLLQRARELLGVGADADAADLTRAYWHHARRVHPDLSPDPEATERFVALHTAYQLALQAALHAPVAAPPPDVSPASNSSGIDLPVADDAGRNAPRPATTGRLTFTAGATRPGDGVWVVAGPVHVQPARGPRR